ncbi:MAG TPA: hypothetical protein VK904_03225 [Miltoncostaeaceae bacterium]|nr:hypothetical protein [Miltoncostaeaceae bacterium]
MVGQIVRRGGPAARFRASLTLKMGIRPTSAFAGTALTAGRVRSWPGGVAPGGPSGRGLDRDGSLPARTLAEGAPRCPIPYPRWQPRSRSTRPSGLITKLLGTLRAQPDLAALKLAAALDEIVDTYRVVDEAFTASASLAPDHDGLTSSSQQPLAIAGGSLASG